ncbi:MAG TPA: tRNA epoxyqueuosine(34) reductase QueG [Thermomicrobiales bacterium]|nr:tRNA epoxyqueuosine(34) reductase QueG [Thermomicrobiales bacterium]
MPDSPPIPNLTLRPIDPRQALTSHVKFLAAKSGLAVSAITSADPFPETARFLDRHIKDGHLAGLDWFTEERANVSADVRNLQPTARSIVSVGLNYWPGTTEMPDDGVKRGRISRYAWGRDYHRVIKRRLKRFHVELEEHVGHPVDVRLLVDTARLVERAVAARSGLGWYGKNACIISPGFGSWILLGEVVVDLDLVPDAPLGKNCGRCTICIDKCPTGAIVAPYTIDTPTCISYLTIEHRGVIARELRPKMGDWVYGCDVCQEVCPYTGAATAADDPELVPASLNNSYPSLHWLLGMSDEDFAATYFGTPVPRTKRFGLARNAAIALGNVGTEDDLPVLCRALEEHDHAIVRGHAAWAVGRVGGGVAKAALDRLRRSEPDEWVREEIEYALEIPARTA